MNEILNQIEALESDLKAAEERKNQLAGQDPMEYQNAMNEVIRISNQLSEKRDELSKLQETQQRVQAKDNAIVGFVDTLSEMFEALFPSAVFRSMFGLNEYEEKRAQFYQLNHAYFAEKVDELHQQNELTLALKDERIKFLNDQSLAVQNQLDEMMDRYNDLKVDYDEIESQVQEANEQVRKITAERDDAIAKFVKADQVAADHESKVVQLQKQLEEAQQPKAEPKTSQKLSDMMKEIKSKNELSADDLLARWNERQKSDEVKIPLPEVKVPEITGSPFRNESDSQTQPSGDQVHSSETTSNVGGSFPDATTGPADTKVQAESPVRDMVSKTVEERLSALETAVFGQSQVA